MKCGNMRLWLLSCVLLFSVAVFSWGEMSERDERARIYIARLLELSKTSDQKAASLEIESAQLKEKSENLTNQLLQVQAELKAASESVTILRQVAEKLEISPDRLEEILPTLEKQAKDWLASLESAQNKATFWRIVSIMMTIMAIIGFAL